MIWNGTENGEGASHDSSIGSSLRVKLESNPNDQRIKDEPADYLDLLENIDTILDENHEGPREPGTQAGILGKTKREESYSYSSDSEYEEARRKRKARKRMEELREYEMR